jgi:hypothetical protein
MLWLNVCTVNFLIEYNIPTLCTDCHSLLYLLFRLLHVSALICNFQGASCTVNVGGLCALVVVVSCVMLSS